MFQLKSSQKGPTVEVLCNDPLLTVPKVGDLSKVESALERNQIITAWYHEVDAFMSAYVGEPEFPSWARFAKHASYTAGVHLQSMQKVRDTFARCASIAQNLENTRGQTLQHSVREIIRSFHLAIRDLRALGHDGALLREGFSLCLKQAGVAQPDLDMLFSRSASPGLQKRTLAVAHNLSRIAAVAKSIPKLIELTDHLFAATANSNQKIYEFMAPRFVALADGRCGQSVISGSPEPSRNIRRTIVPSAARVRKSSGLYSTPGWSNDYL